MSRIEVNRAVIVRSPVAPNSCDRMSRGLRAALLHQRGEEGEERAQSPRLLGEEPRW